VFDDTFSSMEDETLRRAIYLFMQQSRTTVILIGRSTQTHLPLFSRVLHLTNLQGKAGGEEQRQPLTKRVLRSAS
jgi:hypothetical protein